MIRVESVEPDSYAEDLGLLAGDRLLSINGHEIYDLVDYHLRINESLITLEILQQDDEVWELKLAKEAEEDIGLTVESQQPHQCGNQCLFCFVHQLPKGLRPTLYIKDEDYRFSYLYGSYITLTNLSDTDLQRITRDKLSPLYISVHATNHALRTHLLGTEVPEILPLLKYLTAAGIELHCQIVLCPGVNDGTALQQTIDDLWQLYPQVKSLAVVPVGLTKYRQKIPQLREMTPSDAISCLKIINHYRHDFFLCNGCRFVFPADEIYLLAGQQIPPFEDYEDFSQLENGVGMIAQFRQQVVAVLSEAESLELEKITLVTGSLFLRELTGFAGHLSLKTGVNIEVVAIKNNFFGHTVTVAGLITGNDLLEQLQELSPTGGVIIPDVMLKDGEHLFLDDMSVEDISLSLQIPVVAVENSPWGILDGLELLATNPVEIIKV